MMTDVYESCPVMATEHFILRKTEKSDASELLEVYSDKSAVGNMNSDNCHGDTFHYESMEDMIKAIDFWEFSYKNKYFIRWSVIDKLSGMAIGTIELFHRDSEDYFTNCGLLRIDLRSDYEYENNIFEIVTLVKQNAYEMFNCDKIAVKAMNDVRIKAVEAAGFRPTDEMIVGQDKSVYRNYYVLSKKDTEKEN